MTLGTPGSDARWAKCTVSSALRGSGSLGGSVGPSSVVIREDGAGGYQEEVVTGLSAPRLISYAQNSVSRELEVVALHSWATNPAVRVSVSVFPQIQETLIYEDASRVISRPGIPTGLLIEVANRVCGNMEAR